MRAWYGGAVRLAIPLATAVICGLVGYFIAHARLSAPPVQVPVSSCAAQSLVGPKSASAEDAVTKVEKERAAPLQLDRSFADLTRLRADKQQLLVRLAETEQRAAMGEQYRQQSSAEEQKLLFAEERMDRLEAGLAAARDKQTTTDATLLAQEQATQEANNKLSAVRISLNRNSNLCNLILGNCIDTDNSHQDGSPILSMVVRHALLPASLRHAKARRPKCQIATRGQASTVALDAA